MTKAPDGLIGHGGLLPAVTVAAVLFFLPAFLSASFVAPSPKNLHHRCGRAAAFCPLEGRIRRLSEYRFLAVEVTVHAPTRRNVLLVRGEALVLRRKENRSRPFHCFKSGDVGIRRRAGTQFKRPFGRRSTPPTVSVIEGGVANHTDEGSPPLSETPIPYGGPETANIYHLLKSRAWRGSAVCRGVRSPRAFPQRDVDISISLGGDGQTGFFFFFFRTTASLIMMWPPEFQSVQTSIRSGSKATQPTNPDERDILLADQHRRRSFLYLQYRFDKPRYNTSQRTAGNGDNWVIRAR